MVQKSVWLIYSIYKFIYIYFYININIFIIYKLKKNNKLMTEFKVNQNMIDVINCFNGININVADALLSRIF